MIEWQTDATIVLVRHEKSGEPGGLFCLKAYKTKAKICPFGLYYTLA